MKHPAGIGASAVVLVLLSVCQILMGTVMLLAALVPRQAAAAAESAQLPAWVPAFMVALCGVFLAFAAWGITTAVGVYRVRRWARISILIIAGCLGFLSFFSILGLLAAITMPQPIPAGVNPTQTHSTQFMMRVVLAAIALLYAVGLGIAVWWLAYFNRPSVRALFAGGETTLVESRRPLLISVYSVLTLIGVPGCITAALLHLPGLLLWIVLHGWGRAAFYGCSAAVNLAIAIGLWHMREWARRLALFLLAFGMVQVAIELVRPALALQFTAETHRALHLPQPPPATPLGGAFHILTISASLLVLLAIAYMLHFYRSRFAEPGSPVAQPPAMPA